MDSTSDEDGVDNRFLKNLSSLVIDLLLKMVIREIPEQYSWKISLKRGQKLKNIKNTIKKFLPLK